MNVEKVLIIGTGRSGTSTLLRTLSTLLRLKKCGEPWNRVIQGGKDIPEKDVISNYGIVKTLIGHMPLSYDAGKNREKNREEYWNNCVNFYRTFVLNYDKVILLSRKQRKDIALSVAHQSLRPKKYQEWHKPYFALPESKLTLNMGHINRICDSIEKLSKLINVPITWYEDLYSGDHNKILESIEKWNIDISVEEIYKFVDPKNRYRKTDPKVIINNLI